ncbi:uncharacterized protein LOC115669181 [Syzygium oleosum]|uniref:uncharacterized protein LOC115669181 n=1 Tax=Syzygium oleosum TaxID=219896 RepID=UPI0024BB7257|nr:uncharacterized protein LOC115669181 [Syzygium oleosum]
MGNVRSRPESIEQWRRHGSRTRASLPSQALDSGPALVSGTPQQAEELEICYDDIESSPPEDSRTVLMRGGLGLMETPEVTQWQSFTEIYLMENQLTELPEDPPLCPLLLVLFLNRNYKLRTISPSFFDYMPALEILNLSRTRIKSLSESLFRLSRLKRLFLNHCELLSVLPPQIGELQQLEVLDLEGTEIMDLPKEVAKLTKLTCLEVSFCPRVNRGTKSAKANALIPQGTISALLRLEELSIDVNPEDERWESVVEAVVDDVCGLLRLDTLKLYFPQVGYLRKFKWFGTSEVSRSLSHFKFIVGNHDERIMSRLPADLEFELEHWDKSLKYVHGVGVPIDIQKMLRHTTAFFLDRHMNVTKLSDFGIENMEQLKCCIIGECNEIQVIIDGTDVYNEGDRSEIVLGTWEDDGRFLGSLECLYVYRMKRLRSIYEGPLHRGCLSHLKCLTLLTCRRLTTIFTPGLLVNLDSLEELKVEDCPLVSSLVRCEDASIYESTYFLCNLKRISLSSLPELISISNGLRIAPNLERLSITDCPNLESPSTDEICCNHLAGTEAQSIPNDASREQPSPRVVSSTITGNADPSTSQLKREPKVAPRLLKFKFNDLKLAARNFSAASLLGKGGFGCVRGFTNEAIIVAPQLRKFSLNDLKLATRNFSPEALLGEGGSGHVFKGWIEENGTAPGKPGTGLAVAVKTLKLNGYMGHEEWLAEVSLLGHLQHPNLVKLIGYCVKVDQRLLIYEYMQGGSLKDHLFETTLPLTWSIRMKIALDAAKILAFLHEEAEPQLIFRNFKTSKILLDDDYNVKLSGFGLAKIVPKGDDSLSTTGVSGTLGYMDPEYIMTGQLTLKSDVYGFGVVLLEILIGRRVLDLSRHTDGLNLVEWARSHLGEKTSLYELIDSRLGDQFSEKGAQIALQLVASCLSPDREARPWMSEVVEVLKTIQDLPYTKYLERDREVLEVE